MNDSMHTIRCWPAVLLALLVLLARARLVGAQCVNPNLPTAASTRALAMGDANTAGRDDDVIFYGPAQLAIARGTSVAAESFGTHLTGMAIASTARLASGGVGVGVSLVDGRNGAECGTLLFPPSGFPLFVPAPKNVSRAVIVFGAAQTYKRFRVGAAGKYATRDVGDDRASHVLADVGVSRDVTIGDFAGLSIALAVQNIGASAAKASALQTPLRAAIGLQAGRPLGPLDIAVAGQLALERNGGRSFVREGRVLAGAGMELGYTWLEGYSFALRAGDRAPPPLTDLRPFTAGAGLVLDRLAFDYALEILVDRRFAHRFGVRLR